MNVHIQQEIYLNYTHMGGVMRLVAVVEVVVAQAQQQVV